MHYTTGVIFATTFAASDGNCSGIEELKGIHPLKTAPPPRVFGYIRTLAKVKAPVETCYSLQGTKCNKLQWQKLFVEKKKRPPWLNPHTNTLLGFVPAAISLSIIACTFRTALSKPLSSWGELWYMGKSKINLTNLNGTQENPYELRWNCILGTREPARSLISKE